MLFCGWCRGRGVAPVNATIPLLVDFLVHLHCDKGLWVSAGEGYMSSPNSVFALKGMDLAASCEISMLIRSFSKSARPEELHPPAWDVALILQSLTGAQYELLRSSDKHSLSYRVSHSRAWGEVSFSFVPGFVAKMQDPSSSSAPQFEGFTVPALPDSSTNHNGRLLCPVRAVRCYLDCTTPHCPRCEQMFVTAGCSKEEIVKNTVPSFQGDPYPGPPVTARETRGITPALLFKNLAVAQVLKAGTWRRHTTFTRHYLRDLAHRSLETFHLGPVVAAQTLV